MKRIKKQQKERELTVRQYLRVITRTAKVSWQVDHLNFASRILFSTTEVVGLVFATYLGSRVLGELVTSVSAGAVTPNLYRLAIFEAFVLLGVNLSSAFAGLSDRIMYIKWDRWFTLRLNEARARLDTEFYEDRDNQKLLNKLQFKGSWVVGNVADNIIYYYYNFLKMALIFGSVMALGLWAIAVITLASLPRIYAEIKRSKLQWGIWENKGDDFHRHYKTLNLFADQKSLIEIKLYNLKNKLLYGVSEQNIERFTSAQIKASKSTLRAESGAHFIYEATFGGVTLYMLRQAVNGVISIANFSFYAGLLNQFSSAMRNLSFVIAKSSESVLYARDFYTLIDSTARIVSPENAVEISKKEIPKIEFKGVSFAYRSNPEELILKDLNLVINPGEHLALVGENGAGKTTIIKLLLRLYDVTSGEILVNGTNIKEVDLDAYWSQIGVLFQDFNRYPFDIETNIELGRVTKKPTKKELDRATELANLDPILDKLPKGINTILDNSFEEGVEPSGGQWQRVALARAFYRNSNILILDEPTAAVDANAEYEIFNNIFAHYGDKTALIISHRFSTVKRAQRIVVLEKGKILEQGTHKDLMKNSKLYAEMFNKQAEGYKD